MTAETYCMVQRRVKWRQKKSHQLQTTREAFITRTINQKCCSDTPQELLGETYPVNAQINLPLCEISSASLTVGLMSLSIKMSFCFKFCHRRQYCFIDVPHRRREANLQKGRQLLREGKVSEARDCFTRCVNITPVMAHNLIKVKTFSFKGLKVCSFTPSLLYS